MALRSTASEAGLPASIALLLLVGCQPALSADTLKLVQLPADITTGPALGGVQTKEGQIFVAPISGGLLRLGADGGAWDEVPPPLMQRFLPDFQAEGLSFAQGENGLYRAKAERFVAFEPLVPALGNPAFAGPGWSAVLGRDATGVFWATAAPNLGAIEGRVFLAHLEPSMPGDWQYDEVPYDTQPQAVAAAKPVMTSDARFFFKPSDSGLWEIDLPNHVLVQRVACDHELFRASRPELMPCQEATAVFAGRDATLFILNANHELWRIASRGTTPTLVVKGALPKLDLASHHVVGAPRAHVDLKGRVWLSFRWGENVDADVSWLYVAEPASRDAWTFLKSELPRTLAFFGDGAAPLLSSGVQSTGLLVYRVAE